MLFKFCISKMSCMRPMSKRMNELLMECHERLLLKQEPLSTYYIRFAKGLLSRGYIESRSIEIDGKPFEGFYITPKGIEYLENVASG